MGCYTFNQEGFPPKSQLIQTTYNLSFTTFLSHPRKSAPSLLNSTSVAPLPFQGFNNRLDNNSHRTIAIFGLPQGEITSPTTSLPWREFLTCMTTCFFFSDKLSHLERVDHKANNLPLHSTGMTTCLFTSTPR
jgi:hypothetical protein